MRIPNLHLHATGQWYTKWGGQFHYFGKDKPEAERRFLKSLDEWKVWREERSAARTLLLPSRHVPKVIDIAERFLDAREREFGTKTRNYYAGALRRFLNIAGDNRADTIRPKHLQLVKDWMLQHRYAPKTIGHDLTAIRVMFNWAIGLEMIPNVSFHGVKCPPLGPPPDKSLPPDGVKKMVKDAKRKVGENAGHWLAVTYMALLRPTETIRCVNGEGEWIEAGIFRLHRGKMDRVTNFPRHCIFSPAALRRLQKCEPQWNRIDSFSQAVRDALGNGMGPGRLRHSAAQHLSRAGVDPASIEWLLGHVPKRLAVTYYRPDWTALRAKAALLKL